MATGIELILGVMGRSKIDEVVKALDLAITWDENGADLPETTMGHYLDRRLQTVHQAALTEVGLHVEPPKDPIYDYLLVKGLDGIARKTASFGLSLYYDPYEMGDEPETAVFGVSLISRYFPVFLDWQKESGGSGDTIVLDPETLKLIEIGRRHISSVLPFIETAPIIVKELFY